jgi:protein-disulfide isomerase
MPSLRTLPLVLACALLGASACGKSDPGAPGPKPGPSASAAPAEISVKGIDTSVLTARERREWSAEITELLAPCPEVPVSIYQCIQEQRACKACFPAAQLLFKQVQAGKSKKEREDAYHARFDAAKLHTLNTDGAPEIGPPDAIVTIVEWADFECPFCRLVYPILDDLVKHFPGQVRLVYKFYPLTEKHPHAEVAARAGLAAFNQGKFWEMHHAMFENQERLEPADLDRYAKQIGLDMPKFRTDVTAKETAERIDKDKKQAEDAGLEGTPFIFINGRNADLQLLANPYDDLVDWVKLDIELAGKVPNIAPSSSASAGSPKPPPSGSASVAPAVSASAGKPGK